MNCNVTVLLSGCCRVNAYACLVMRAGVAGAGDRAIPQAARCRAHRRASQRQLFASGNAARLSHRECYVGREDSGIADAGRAPQVNTVNKVMNLTWEHWFKLGPTVNLQVIELILYRTNFRPLQCAFILAWALDRESNRRTDGVWWLVSLFIGQWSRLQLWFKQKDCSKCSKLINLICMKVEMHIVLTDSRYAKKIYKKVKMYTVERELVQAFVHYSKCLTIWTAFCLYTHTRI